MYTAITFLVVNLATLFGLYVDERQRRVLDTKTIPDAAKKFCTQETFDKSRRYGKEKIVLRMMATLAEHGLFHLVLLGGFVPYCWAAGRRMAGALLCYPAGCEEETVAAEIFSALFFFLIEGVPSTVLSLPFSLYAVFGIEQRYSFNTQTLGQFFLDKVKELFVSVTVLLVLLLVFIPVGRVLLQIASVLTLFFVFWALLVLFQVAMVVVMQEWILPFFNKFSPLENDELRTKIEKLCTEVRFPLKRIFVMDGSKRSTHSNAFFIGIGGKKTIVVFDTMLEKLSHEEILAVVAHELGHWHHNHILLMLLATQIYTATSLGFFLYLFQCRPLYVSFGIEKEMPFAVGAVLCGLLYTPLSCVLSFLFNRLSRRNEFQADGFAVEHECGASLKEALVRLQTENLSSVVTDRLYSMYNNTHPTLVERIQHIEAREQKAK
ncbi:MAG: CAAX prenyl protease 1 [Amphiamblys sp. WSBS2006]|nr:MAG: CAAX prenyl protease 1 [Amphiamblys sp. WSBS2006]